MENFKKYYFFIYLLILGLIESFIPLKFNCIRYADDLWGFIIISTMISAVICTGFFFKSGIIKSILSILISNGLILFCGNRVFNILDKRNKYFSFELSSFTLGNNDILFNYIFTGVLGILICIVGNIVVRILIKVVKRVK